MGTGYAVKPPDLYAFEADLPSRHGHAVTKPPKAAAGIEAVIRRFQSEVLFWTEVATQALLPKQCMAVYW